MRHFYSDQILDISNADFFILPEGKPPPHCTPTLPYLSVPYSKLTHIICEIWNAKQLWGNARALSTGAFCCSSLPPKRCYVCDDDDDAGTAAADISTDEQRIQYLQPSISTLLRLNCFSAYRRQHGKNSTEQQDRMGLNRNWLNLLVTLFLKIFILEQKCKKNKTKEYHLIICSVLFCR